MDINNYGLREEMKDKNDFVEELIYENIKLMDENINILLVNRRLVERLEELSRINKLLTDNREAGDI